MYRLSNNKAPVFCRLGTGLFMAWLRTMVGIACLQVQRRHALSITFLALMFPALYLDVATAGNLSVLVNGKALHMSPPGDVEYNEENWGAGVQYDLEPLHDKWVPFLTASGFIDSFDNPSYYTGAGLVRRMRFNDRVDSMHFDAGVIGFLMTRRDFKGGDPFFGMLPALSFGTRRYAVNMTYIPKVNPKMVALWFFQLKISTDNF